MSTRLPIVPAGAILLQLFAAAAGIGQVTASQLRPSEYRAILEQLDRKVDDPNADLKSLADRLPPEWDIRSGQDDFPISSTPVRLGLTRIADGKQGQKSDAIGDFHNDLRRRITALESFSQPVDASAPAKLQTILARAEFRHSDRGDPYAPLKDLAMRWLERLLEYPGSQA